MSGLPYNGWPVKVRFGRARHYSFAVRNGLLQKSSTCIGCGANFRGRLHYHAEEYGPTAQDYWNACVPVCVRCHAMIHARFAIPNLWKKYLSQIAQQCVDDAEFPAGTHIAACLRRFKTRPDQSDCGEYERGTGYLESLPVYEYVGPEKVATLLVVDPNTGVSIEVPDWIVYGFSLERLSPENQIALTRRAVCMSEYFAYLSRLPRDPSGRAVLPRRELFQVAPVTPPSSGSRD